MTETTPPPGPPTDHPPGSEGKIREMAKRHKRGEGLFNRKDKQQRLSPLDDFDDGVDIVPEEMGWTLSQRKRKGLMSSSTTDQLSFRDHVAVEAMKAMIPLWHLDVVATKAYELADDMIEERNRDDPQPVQGTEAEGQDGS